ncbi:S8 family serine peptidase [Williamwhitmania taraxaci]|uniref:Serine protease, subtilisin family n=1 Tax=Williamwhitmania taraxaci TaxID=1640674 RepID=A0A1G6Q2W2_9BACT|nr:S8 family serine peptidase [Williamwhitmania taraxaci]SDC86693.1 Serine protease, subtilisin family [Williamwhitmania taraxaci]
MYPLRKLLAILGFTMMVLPFANAQSRYWIQLTDKRGTTFDPNTYFDRVQHEVAGDSTNFPLNESYLQQIKKVTGNIGRTSRWLNAVALSANKRELKALAKLPFVKDITPITGNYVHAEFDDHTNGSSDKLTEIYDILNRQTQRMGARYFTLMDSSIVINGKGIRIAVFDGGFPGVNTQEVFSHIRNENRIIATWDFTKNNENVYRGISHGTNVLSCIAGIHEGTAMGMATGAEFLLAITEVNSEPFSEEENWLAAVEWAHKNGADIISSSLGYTFNRYFPTDMDGKKTFVARAATLAARKGMLVINAAGNDGDSDWKVLGTPADADSILTVGGVSPDNNLHIDFSSYGPTADGRMKPNVSAFGKAVVAKPKGGVQIAYGTSFATPLISGFVACAWQINRNKSAMEMLKLIEQSGDLYPYFDYAHGYGVPQANFFIDSLKEPESTFDLYEDDTYYNVFVPAGYVKLLSGYNTTILFYNIENEKGVLTEYGAVRVYQEKALSLFKKSFKKGYKLNIKYLNYSGTFNLGDKEEVGPTKVVMHQ